MTGHDLKVIREKLGLSLSELAAETGVSRASITSYQSGRRPIPEVFARLVVKLRPKRKAPPAVTGTASGERSPRGRPAR